jgi:hydrogenase expression/formation protein HypC
MQIQEIHGFNALCSAKGVEREVNLFLLGEGAVKPGDYVIVHVGYAIQKMSEEEARSTWELLDEILALEGPAAAGPPA